LSRCWRRDAIRRRSPTRGRRLRTAWLWCGSEPNDAHAARQDSKVSESAIIDYMGVLPNVIVRPEVGALPNGWIEAVELIKGKAIGGCDSLAAIAGLHEVEFVAVRDKWALDRCGRRDPVGRCGLGRGCLRWRGTS
jgi:hypothetical protein